jgi:ABC-type polysaccharide/polyol phosphate transport system ATPase subunit
MNDSTSQFDTSISLEGVGLRFRKYASRHQTLKHSAMNLLRRRRYAHTKDFWIYRGFDLQVNHGESVGVIGRNGAGKTTLLKLLAGVYAPNEGRLEVRGRIAPLIELSTGMSGELSAMENIVLAGVYMGRSPREMRRRVPSILDFAGLEEFSETPLKYYSTGMKRRLAFALATDINPQIFLIDEIFSGGDKDFVAKGTERMRDLLDAAHIVVVVSHAIKLIRELTTRTIWIDEGKVVADGPTEQITKQYLASKPTESLGTGQRSAE